MKETVMRKVNKFWKLERSNWLNRPEKLKPKCSQEHGRELQQEAKNSSPEALKLDMLLTSGWEVGRRGGVQIVGLVESLYKEHLNTPLLPNLTQRGNCPFPSRQNTDLLSEYVDIKKIWMGRCQAQLETGWSMKLKIKVQVKSPKGETTCPWAPRIQGSLMILKKGVGKESFTETDQSKRNNLQIIIFRITLWKS